MANSEYNIADWVDLLNMAVLSCVKNTKQLKVSSAVKPQNFKRTHVVHFDLYQADGTIRWTQARWRLPVRCGFNTFFDRVSERVNKAVQLLEGGGGTVFDPRKQP